MNPASCWLYCYNKYTPETKNVTVNKKTLKFSDRQELTFSLPRMTEINTLIPHDALKHHLHP